jgi:hypothetical protein
MGILADRNKDDISEFRGEQTRGWAESAGMEKGLEERLVADAGNEPEPPTGS